MKVTVEFSASEIKDICRMTGESKKGPAVRKFVIHAMMMKRRKEIADQFIAGEGGVKLTGFESARAISRALGRKYDAKWRGHRFS